jgi:DNA-binding MurR/RpiR family transcriptional regulator
VLFDLAIQQGSTTLLITDSMLNPLARLASHVICAKPYFDAEARIMDVTAPTHLIYAMVRKIAADYPDKVEAFRRSSMRRFEEYID